MRHLIDFINHGILPFSGREPERARLIGFWNGTVEAHEMQVLALAAEAGMGKSRLVEEVIPVVRREGGLVVHVKIYPGATTSLAPLFARAIWYSDGRELLREEPEGGLPSVIALLRRLARLRPLLIVVEDVHLLAEEELADFASLVEGISDEPLSLLCLVREGDYPARGVLARYSFQELHLEGLKTEELRTLWRELFGEPDNPAVLDLFERRTLGNPLALRSALRNAIHAGVILPEPNGDGWRLNATLEELDDHLSREVGLLSSGMVAHLTPAELDAAARVAQLGETFPRSAALEVLGDERERLLGSLRFRGIISPSRQISCLVPASSTAHDRVYAFTHSLLHLHLIQIASVDVDTLLDLVLRRLPVCSAVPYRLIRTHASESKRSPGEIAECITILLGDARRVDQTSQWEGSRTFLEAAEALFAGREETWPEEERRLLRGALLDGRLALMQRESYTAEYARLTLAFEKETASVLPEALPGAMAEYAVAALGYLYHVRRRQTDLQPGAFDAIWNRLDDLLAAHPHLRRSDRYIDFLRIAGRVTNIPEDSAMIHRVEERLNELLDANDTPEELRNRALREVAPSILWRFYSEEELRKRLELLAKIEGVTNRNDIIFRSRKMALLDGIGRSREALAIADELIPIIRERGLKRDVINVRLFRIYAMMAFGLDLERAKNELEAVEEEAPAEVLRSMRRSAGTRMMSLCMLRGEIAWARCMSETLVDVQDVSYAEERLLLTLLTHENRDARRAAVQDLMEEVGDRVARNLGPNIVLLAHGRIEDRSALVDEIRTVLTTGIFLRTDVLTRRLVIELVEGSGDDELLAAVRKEIERCVRDSLVWLAEKELFAFVGPFLERFKDYLAKKEITAWREREESLRREWGHLASPAAADGRMTLSMLGTVAICSADGAESRVRGARLRAVLGLMVADEMTGGTLSYRDFCEIASGGLNEQERARKMTTMATLRLRETYGDDIVITGEGEKPRLNFDRVRVDLLDAHELIRRTLEELRRGGILQARTALERALGIVGDQVPFPNLYDDFFEAARSDFDFSVRRAVIETARSLVREGDTQAAEAILRRSLEGAPGDEEVAELLISTLERLGKKIEATKIRRKAELV